MSGLLTAVMAGLLGMFGWGSADYFASTGMKKEITEEAANFWLNVSGVLVFSVGLIVYSVLTQSPIELPPLSVFGLFEILLLACMNFIAYMFFFKALREGELSVVSSVFSTYAAGAVIVSALLFGEEIPALRAIALAIVIVGVILMSVVDIRNFTKVKGVKWVIPAVILFSILFPLWSSIASRGGSFVLVLFIDTFLAIMYFLYGKVRGKVVVSKIRLIKPFIIAGILTMGATISISWGYEHTNVPSIITVVSSAVPIISAFLGYFVMKERLTKQQYFGLATIVFGIILLFG